MSEGSKDYKSYRNSAIMFMISGMVFIILSISKIYFLPIGIALVIVGVGIWRKSRKIKENEQDSSSGVNH
ncbi:hypothetical protein ACFLUE_02475 [Chloroflexota bacterium]